MSDPLDRWPLEDALLPPEDPFEPFDGALPEALEAALLLERVRVGALRLPEALPDERPRVARAFVPCPEDFEPRELDFEDDPEDELALRAAS